MPIQTFSLERFNTPTGVMLIVSDEQDRVCAVDWEDHEARMRRLLTRWYGKEIRLCESRSTSAARGILEQYFDGKGLAAESVEMAENGSEFKRLVWTALKQIPAGRTESYAAVATRLGRLSAARAVGLAVAANPIAVLIPCHRVVGSNGSLTGYAGGLDRKRWLLAHEAGTGKDLRGSAVSSIQPSL